MDQRDLLRLVAEAFEEAGAEYLFVGAVASTAYGEPRLTLDIDVVAGIGTVHLPRFLARFASPDFYVSREAAEEAVRTRRTFNIIHISSGLKVDVIVRKEDDFDRSRFSRKKNLAVFPDRVASFASPEDVIIKKMEFFLKGGSDKHLRDIAGIIKVSGESLDKGYIEQWSARKGLMEIWRMILSRTGM